MAVPILPTRACIRDACPGVWGTIEARLRMNVQHWRTILRLSGANFESSNSDANINGSTSADMQNLCWLPDLNGFFGELIVNSFSKGSARPYYLSRLLASNPNHLFGSFALPKWRRLNQMKPSFQVMWLEIPSFKSR